MIPRMSGGFWPESDDWGSEWQRGRHARHSPVSSRHPPCRTHFCTVAWAERLASKAWSTYAFIQSTPRGSQWVYRGKTILLVDERTISPAEHTGLFLEAANKTTIVGSPTMGANGDVTTVALVGGMYATFTGHDVRHAAVGPRPKRAPLGRQTSSKDIQSHGSV